MSVGTDPLLAAFDERVRGQGERILVSDGDRSWRTTDVDIRALTLMKEAGRPPRVRGEIAGLSAPNGPGFLVSLIALLRLGYAPLLLDHGLLPVERRAIASALGASCSLLCGHAWPSGSGSWSWEDYEQRGDDSVAPGVDLVKLSSGTTGRPRGIGFSMHALLSDERALRSSMGIGPDDRLLVNVPLSHSYGFSSLVLPALANGNPLILPAARHPLAILEAAEIDRATVFPTVPSFLGALLRIPSPPALPRSLRLIVSAGAPLHASVAHQFRSTLGRPVHVFYGASECGGITYDREGGAAERGSVGEPIDHVDVDLVETVGAVPGAEAANRNEIPGAHRDPTGVVRVRSDAVAERYLPLRDPHLEDGMFTSQDLARWLGGELALLGRIDDLLSFRGRKFHPAEIERVLLTLPGVEEVSVFGIDDPGRVGETQVAAVIACPSRSISVSEAIDFCRARLAPFKVPRLFRIVGELPRTCRGKIDGRQVEALVR